MSKNLTTGRVWLVLIALGLAGSAAHAKALDAPPGLFRDLDDVLAGDALVINGKQLFIDDYIIETLEGAARVLNQPVKHPDNPLILADQPWEKDVGLSYGNVLHDKEEGLYKMWYNVWIKGGRPSQGALCYATSRDGMTWEKPIVNAEATNNIVFGPGASLGGNGVFKDATDPERPYKMMFCEYPDGTASSSCTSAAYSRDGIHWQREPQNPAAPFSDTQICPYRDERLGRYVAYLRYGPPNTRMISRIESEDFVHWSPKVTVIRRTRMDGPLVTKHYGMRIMPYEGVYIGILTAYYGETIQPIPPEKEAWMDKVNAQLAFSRNGLTWQRVGLRGAIPHAALSEDRDWQTITEQAAFIPYGEHEQAWDWGSIYTFQAPLVVGDEIRFYYTGHTGRHWASYHGDTTVGGIGLATLRLDGFVAVQAEAAGTLTTRTFIFIGDTLEVNANGTGGAIRVEALDAAGAVIEGFSVDASLPLTTDSVRHVLQWQDQPDAHLLQARPIKLRFHLEKARLYSFTPRILHKHYVPSYD